MELLLEQHPDVRDPFYNTLSGRTAAVLVRQMAGVKTAVESLGPPSHDALDAELNDIKTELDRHHLHAARHLATRLEERFADKLSPRQRWRVLTLKAGTYLAEGDLERAGPLFIQAKAHQPLEEKAQVNEALGYELVGDPQRAHALAVALRQAFPFSSTAAALWVRTSPETVGCADLEAEVASFVDRESDVSLALAVCTLNRGDVDRAERHARRTTELEADLPQAWLMLGQALHVRGFREVRADPRHALFQQADAHYTRAAELAGAQGNVRIEAAAFLNRAVVRDFMGTDDAEPDYRRACHLTPRNASAMRKLALYFADHGRMDQAVKEIRTAATVEPNNGNVVLLAALLWDRNRDGDRKEALDLCLNVVRGSEPGRVEDALDLVVLALSESGRWDDAEKLLNDLPKERMSEVARNTLLAHLRLSRDDRTEAESLARAAHGLVDAVTAVEDLRRLARLLGKMRLYALALPLLQHLATPGRYNADTRMLLACANQLQNHRVILDVCRAIREAGAGDRRLLDNELDILQLYDRPAAIVVLQAHLARQPDDRLAHLRLSLLGVQAERPDLVTSDLGRLPLVEEAPPATVGRGVVGLLLRTGRLSDALRYAYALLRVNFNDPDAHLVYCNFVLSAERDGLVIEPADVVQPGAAVAYREVGDSQVQWVVVEDADDDLLADELPPDHPRVLRMAGKKRGDTFPLSTTGVQERTAEVLEILSKYVRRFQDCLRQFQVRFPERPDLQQVRLTREGNEGDEQLDLTPIFAALDHQREQVQNALGLYRGQPAPVHLLANSVGRNVFETLDFLTADPNTGVRWCCLGNTAEREAALAAWRTAEVVVLDLTALYTAWRLDLLGVLRGWSSRRFCVGQATFDKLRDIVDGESRPGPKGYTTTNAPGRYAFGEVSEEARRPRVESLHKLVSFVRDCCTVESTPDLATLDSDRRALLTEMVDRDGLQSVALAGRAGYLLWTDDLTLGIIGRENFSSTRRAWTQAVLHAGVEEGVLSQDEFDGHCARLIGLRYSFTWCSPEIVLRAGAISDWNCEAWPLRQVVRYFRRDDIQPQAKLRLAAHAIVGMSRSVLSPFARQAFILAVLNQLGSRRLAVALAEGLGQLFGADALAEMEAVETIRIWVHGPLFIP